MTLAPALAATECPRCSRCTARMALIRAETGKRIFGCAKCKSMETKMTVDPMKSYALARLANSLRPPS